MPIEVIGADRASERDAAEALRTLLVPFIGPSQLLINSMAPNNAVDLTPGGAPCRSAIKSVAGAGHRERWASRVSAQ